MFGMLELSILPTGASTSARNGPNHRWPRSGQGRIVEAGDVSAEHARGRLNGQLPAGPRTVDRSATQQPKVQFVRQVRTNSPHMCGAPCAPFPTSGEDRCT